MMLATMARWGAIFGAGSSDDRDNPLGIVGVLAMSILAPIGAMLIQMAVSRSREYQADATGARFAGSPEGLARALEKLGAYSGRVPMHTNEAATKATAHMFIVNPLSARALGSMFSTHPPLEDRIARLRGTPPVQGGRYHDGPADQTQDQGQAQAQAADIWRRMS